MTAGTSGPKGCVWVGGESRGRVRGLSLAWGEVGCATLTLCLLRKHLETDPRSGAQARLWSLPKRFLPIAAEEIARPTAERGYLPPLTSSRPSHLQVPLRRPGPWGIILRGPLTARTSEMQAWLQPLSQTLPPCALSPSPPSVPWHELQRRNIF